jgi:hypothetical protein
MAEDQLYFVKADITVNVKEIDTDTELEFHRELIFNWGGILELSKFELLNLPHLKGRIFDTAVFPFTYGSREYKSVKDCESYDFNLIHVNRI